MVAGAPPRWETWDAVFALVLLASVGVYARGVSRLCRSPAGRHAMRPWQIGAFALSWLSLAVALASPLAPLADALLSAHVTQHGLLILAAAPLVALARPGVPLLWALSWHRRERLAIRLRRPAVRRAWRRATAPLTVFLLHAAALWVGHVPALFEAALRNKAVHAVQHAAFFWTAVLLWRAVGLHRNGRHGYGPAGFLALLTCLQLGGLGALLTWAPSVWYRTYEGRTEAWGSTALEDQHIAGLVTLASAGVVLVVVGLALLAAWLGEAEARAELSRSAATKPGTGSVGDAS